MKRRKNIKIQESWKEREKKDQVMKRRKNIKIQGKSWKEIKIQGWKKKRHQVMKRRKNIKIQESWKERGKERPSDEKKKEY